MIKKDLEVVREIEINASSAEVWDALINPKKIKKYLFGSEAVSDWQIGSELIFQGEYKGVKYKDHGVITKLDPKNTFQYTYLSSFSGLEPEEGNFSLITFRLEQNDGSVLLKLSQKGFKDVKSQSDSDAGWGSALIKIKEIAEQHKV